MLKRLGQYLLVLCLAAQAAAGPWCATCAGREVLGGVTHEHPATHCCDDHEHHHEFPADTSFTCDVLHTCSHAPAPVMQTVSPQVALSDGAVLSAPSLFSVRSVLTDRPCLKPPRERPFAPVLRC